MISEESAASAGESFEFLGTFLQSLYQVPPALRKFSGEEQSPVREDHGRLGTEVGVLGVEGFPSIRNGAIVPQEDAYERGEESGFRDRTSLSDGVRNGQIISYGSRWR